MNEWNYIDQSKSDLFEIVKQVKQIPKNIYVDIRYSKMMSKNPTAAQVIPGEIEDQEVIVDLFDVKFLGDVVTTIDGENAQSYDALFLIDNEGIFNCQTGKKEKLSSYKMKIPFTDVYSWRLH